MLLITTSFVLAVAILAAAPAIGQSVPYRGLAYQPRLHKDGKVRVPKISRYYGKPGGIGSDYVASPERLVRPAASAGARNLPREMLGAWCPVEVPFADYNIFERAKCQVADQLVMEPDGSFRGHEYCCQLIRLIDKGLSTYLGWYLCRGQGDTWTRNLSISYEMRTNELTLWNVLTPAGPHRWR